MTFVEWTVDAMLAIKQRCRGLFFIVVLLGTAFVGYVMYSPLFLIVFLLGLPSARFIVDTVVSTWFALAVAVYELLYGVKIVVMGDTHKLEKHCSSLIVMNHRTRLDWLFYFSVQARYGSLRRFKISLKDQLKHVPGAGWAMQTAQFIFLKRSWETDKDIINSSLKHFKTFKCSPQLLLFPEGTDFTPSTRQKSFLYAKKNDLINYEYVLHPRTTGFTSVVAYMKMYNDLKQIIDVSIAYPQNILQNETGLLSSNLPREIVFTVTCFEVANIPTHNDKELAEWLEERWRVKDMFLKSFYEEKKHLNISCGLLEEQVLEIERDTKLYLIGALCHWSIVTGIAFYLLLYCSTCRWIFMMLCILYTLISSTIGFNALFMRLPVRT